MSPAEVIKAYVIDVAKRLPGKQRNDVGFELRTLLEEQLRGRAADEGRLPDEAMAIAMLREFGAPDEVAARYGGPGLTIIEPIYADRFIKLGAAGVAIQWLLTLPGVFASDDPWLALSRWWMGVGLGAFWWPGFVVTCAVIAAWARRRWPLASTWHPKVVDHALINRSLVAMGAGLVITASALMVVLPSLLKAMMPAAALPYFTFDAAFWMQRAPFILPLWSAHVTLLGFLVVHGRWTPRLRMAEAAINLAICAVMVWWMAAGPVFEAASTDRSVTFAFVVIIAAVLFDLVVKLRRGRARVRPPAEIAGRTA